MRPCSESNSIFLALRLFTSRPACSQAALRAASAPMYAPALAVPDWVTPLSVTPREEAMRAMSLTERPARLSTVRVGSASTSLLMSWALPSVML